MNKYCVYYHYDKDEVVRYVGSGTISRANKNYANSGRGHRYVDFVTSHGKLNVKIVHKELTKAESIRLEIELYYLHIETLLNIKKPSTNLNEVTQEVLDRVIYCENVPGCLLWKNKGSSGSNVKIGNPVGSLDGVGYYSTRIENISFKNHRIIYALFNGIDSLQGKVVDHINSKRSDNRISNLRAITQAENSRNATKRKRKHDLPTGVKFKESNNSFIAYVTDPSQQYSNGTNKKVQGHFPISKYKTRELALEAAIKCRNEMLSEINQRLNLGYTDDHGM